LVLRARKDTISVKNKKIKSCSIGHFVAMQHKLKIVVYALGIIKCFIIRFRKKEKIEVT